MRSALPALPAGHGICVAKSGQKCPARHGVSLVDPAGQNEPSEHVFGQAASSVVCEGPSLPHLPAGHFVHTVAPAALNVPGGHTVADVDPVQELPASHATQELPLKYSPHAQRHWPVIFVPCVL